MSWLLNIFFLSTLYACSLAKPQDFSLNPTVTDNKSNVEEKDCVCVYFYLCRNNTLVTDGRGILVPRLKTNCPVLGQVCCPIGEELPSNTTTPSPTGLPTPTVSPTPRVGTPEPTTASPRPVKPDDKPPLGCGYRNPDGVGFRLNAGQDSNAEFGEYPWMVAVFLYDVDENNKDNSLTYKCGGSLIHPKVVLTAAHCVVASKRGKKFKIRAGEWDLQSRDETAPHQERDVETVILHKQYSSGTLQNDIALLFLVTPVQIANTVDIMCLPPKGTVSTSQKCIASGWGKDSDERGQTNANILRRVELPMVAHDKCQTSLRASQLGAKYNLHSTFVCAGGEQGKDTCKGDGGSPLMCPIQGHKERYQQIGIVSWGIGCGDGRTPGLFANVAALRDWIDEQMASKQLDTKSYTY